MLGGGPAGAEREGRGTHGQVARLGAPGAAERLGDLLEAGPHQAGQADDLAAMRVAINDAMEHTKDWPGVNGVFNITPTDHLGLDKRSTFLSQIRGDKFLLIEE